ncbi:polymer-forming cytoskeletal protein [Shewanella livingstonensis]|uniref:Polymer-forming cytoskeletal protein n=1 Tax=Shewanella livingstonensis TaxID=150120 RepID=A0A3G8M0R6_9GAMM|nr:polymer-forming cytoskeletal protein [Shewanella livingstonensis]AZG74578.1 polymer-forming cytoskeletal protein [Shewanella livingstonensis]
MNNKNKGITYIGIDMALEGDVRLQGPAVVAGQTKGTINSTDQIKIEQGGVVEGEVFCQEMRVSGLFKGKLHCNKLVIVSSGIVEGEVASHQMEIYDGGQFVGMRTKGPDASGLPQADIELTSHQQAHKPSGAANSVFSGRKLIYAAVATIVIIAATVLQPTISKVLNGGQILSADINQANVAQYPQSTSSVTEDNAAVLLQEMDQQTSFVEQAEELINAGQSDINVAMEDLHALAQTSEALGDSQTTSDDVEQHESTLVMPDKQ